MNARRTFAIARRIAEFFRRDHRTLALVFVAPIVIMALLGWVIRDQKPPTSTVAVVNDAGALGEVARQRLSSSLTSAGFGFRDDITTDDAAHQAVQDGSIDIALIVSVDGATPRVVILTQGLNPADDAARVGDLRTVLSGAFAQAGPIIDQQTIYNQGGTFFDAFAPALVGFVVFFLVFILTGISFLRERVGGTLERLLATPVRRQEIVVGYSAGFGIFATLQVALVLLFVLGTIHLAAMGPLPEINLGLGVPSAGSPWLAFVITLLLAISAVNLGIFLSTFARTEFQILQFIPLIIVPQVLLSGIFWPVASLPGILAPIAHLMPMTYGIEGLREVLIKGSGLESPTVQLDILVLAGLAIGLAFLATVTIRREVA
ncbi:MAG TPA: ABC transporter permease [Candidatus Limnocylindrales bacterium]